MTKIDLLLKRQPPEHSKHGQVLVQADCAANMDDEGDKEDPAQPPIGVRQ